MSISPTRGPTRKRGSPYPQIEGPHESMAVHRPNSRGYMEAWESVSPIQRDTGSEIPYPQLEGPSQSMGVHIPNLRGHPEAWGIPPHGQGHSTNRNTRPSQAWQTRVPLQACHLPVHSMTATRIPNSRGHTEAWVSISPTRGAAHKHGTQYPIQGDTRQHEIPCPQLRVHPKPWESISPN